MKPETLKKFLFICLFAVSATLSMTAAKPLTLKQIEEMSGAQAENLVNGKQYVDLGLPSGNLWYVGDDYVSWNENSKYPSKKDYEELILCCTWKWVEVEGLKGYLVTGLNKNSIFLPAAGYFEPGLKQVRGKGFLGQYWSSTTSQNKKEEMLAWSLRFGDKGKRMTTAYKGVPFTYCLILSK